MLTMIEGLPDHVIGIRITDKLRAKDYSEQLIPLINERLETHRKLDFLCCIEGEWKGMEAGAAWQDLRLGFGKLGHWGRLALVSDIKWLENAMTLFRLFAPGELQHFDSANYERAREWVCEQDRVHIGMTQDLDTGILMLEPAADTALGEDDFEAVGTAVSEYLKDHERLPGIMLRSRRAPDWQNIGALFAHLKLVHSVHDKIGKVALVTNSPMGAFADHVLDPLMLAGIRQFDYDQNEEAIAWLKS